MTEADRQRYLREAQGHLARAAQVLAYAEEPKCAADVWELARDVDSVRTKTTTSEKQ